MEPVKNGSRHGVSGVAAIPAFNSGNGSVEATTTQTGITLPFNPLWWQSEQVRRVINVVVATLMLVVLSPIMLLIALLVGLTSRGPIFYRQTRVGIDRRQRNELNGNWRRNVDYGGQLFRIYKFRTMYVNADQIGEVWACPGDPRVTLVGRFLRKYRLDELPQLINVIKGEMNLVGPRPEQPKIFLELRDQIDRYEYRQSVLPGITGWAQINQHYDSCLDDVKKKLQFDLEYIQRRSATEDLRILMRTVPVIIFQKGAW